MKKEQREPWAGCPKGGGITSGSSRTLREMTVSEESGRAGPVFKHSRPFSFINCTPPSTPASSLNLMKPRLAHSASNLLWLPHVSGKEPAFSSPLLTSHKPACLSQPRGGSGLCQSGSVLSLTSFSLQTSKSNSKSVCESKCKTISLQEGLPRWHYW